MSMFKSLKTRNKKRGFTLVETVVGLTIIAIVATAALSLYFNSEKAVQSAHQKQQAQFHVSNIIACYRVSNDESEFKTNVAFALDVEQDVVNMGTTGGSVDLGNDYFVLIACLNIHLYVKLYGCALLYLLAYIFCGTLAVINVSGIVNDGIFLKRNAVYQSNL